MPAPLHLAGKHFGDLEVLQRVENDLKGYSQFLCKCSCGTEKVIQGKELKRGRVRTCGCGVFRRTAEEKKAFETQQQKEEGARKVLADPAASFTAKQTAERVIRLADKHRKVLEDQVRDRKQEVLAEKATEKSTSELERLQNKYPETDVLPSGEDQALLLANLRSELPALIGPIYASLRFYVLGRIAEIESAIEQEQHEVAARQTEQEKRQAIIDTLACNNAEARIMEKVSPVLRINNLPLDKRKALQNYCSAMQKNARKYAKTVEGHDASGAQRKVIAQHIERVYDGLVEQLEVYKFNPNTEGTSTSGLTPDWAERILSPENFIWRTFEEQCHIAYVARLVYRNNGMAAELASVPPFPEPLWAPEPPNQSLEGVIARANLPLESSWSREAELAQQQEALEQLRVTDSKAYKELLKKGPGLLEDWQRLGGDERRDLEKTNYKKARTFKEIEKYLKPIDTTIPIVVYLVPTNTLDSPRNRPRMFWPSGDELKEREIFYDSVLKCWVKAPEPAAVDANFGGGHRKMECVQDDYGNWVKRTVDEESRWEQNLEGKWVHAGESASSRWAKPQRITFKSGQRYVPHVGRESFREGFWWSAADIEKAESGWVPTPPKVLPDLKPTIADSIATVPVYKEDRWEAERLRQWGPA